MATVKDKRGLNLNLTEKLMDAIDVYRHKRMFASRTEAIEALLWAGLKANPPKPEEAK